MVEKSNPILKIVSVRSPEYLEALELRRKILRRPLNLDYKLEDLEAENNDMHFVICFKSQATQTVVGCLLLRPMSSKLVKMRQVAVDQSQQGMGIGKNLVLGAEEWAKTNQFEIIELHARENAVSFYTKLGYQPVGEVFFEVTIPHTKMVKRLK